MSKGVRYFFRNGYNRVTVGDIKQLRSDLTEVIGGNASYFSYMLNRGIRNISKGRYDAISNVFHKYGIAEEDIWTVVEE